MSSSIEDSVDQYAKNVKDMIAEKMINDYDDIVEIFKDKEIYSSRISYKTYENNTEYQSQTLILTLKIRKTSELWRTKVQRSSAC